MPTRSKGEKAKIEKRIRTENTVRTVVIVFAIAVFIVLSIVFKDSKSQRTIMAEQTPAPTLEPCLRAAFDMGMYYKKSFSQGKDIYLLSFRSEADAREVTVKLYKKDGIACMKIVREITYIEVEMVQEGMFEKWHTQPIKEEESAELKAVSKELADCLSYLYEGQNSEGIESKVYSSILSLFSTGNTDTSFLYGTYKININIDNASVCTLTLTFEPI